MRSGCNPPAADCSCRPHVQPSAAAALNGTQLTTSATSQTQAQHQAAAAKRHPVTAAGSLPSRRTRVGLGVDRHPRSQLRQLPLAFLLACCLSSLIRSGHRSRQQRVDCVAAVGRLGRPRRRRWQGCWGTGRPGRRWRWGGGCNRESACAAWVALAVGRCSKKREQRRKLVKARAAV